MTFEMSEKNALASSRLAGVAGAFAGGNSLLYWLLLAPAVIVFFYQMGRGLGNTGYVLYWIAAVVLLVRQRNFDFPIAASVLFVVLLAWGTLSAALSVDPHSAYGKWAQYALLGTSYFITWRLIRHIPEFSVERALKMIGIVGLISFAHYAGRYLVLSMSPDFQPELQVHGLVPAYLSPFTLYFLRQSVPGKRGIALSLAYLTSLVLLLVFSNSLTEVLTLAAALGVMIFFVVPNKRLLMLALGGVALLFAALILLFDPAGAVLDQANGTDGTWFALLSELSSYRTLIWYKALTIPPPNLWLGVGPGNVGLYPPVVISETAKVGHLHNLVLDSWYEIGVVGLIVYLLFYGAQFRATKPGAGKLSSQQRGVMYAAVAGIFVASMLEQSYRSHHVALFVPFLFALYSRGAFNTAGPGVGLGSVPENSNRLR
jgi:O-antigen ligase